MPRQTLKQRADGRYVCRCDDRYFLGTTQKEALAARDAYKRDKAEGTESRGAGRDRQHLRSQVAAPSRGRNVGKATYNEYARIMNVFISHFSGQPMMGHPPRPT